MSLAITHTSECDTVGCVNEGVLVDAYSDGGTPLPVYCGGCSQDISHTLALKE
jgi:hypothetical protein